MVGEGGIQIVTGGVADWLEYGPNLGIGLLALGLAALTRTAYRRNRESERVKELYLTYRRSFLDKLVDGMADLWDF